MARRAFTGLLLAFTVAVTLLGGTARAAGPTLTVHAPAELPAVGESFTVEVRITDNPGLCTAQFTLAFDSDVVACRSAKMGTVLAGTLSAVNPNAPGGAILAAATVEPVETDGVLGTFTFQVLKDGEPAFVLRDGVFCNADGEDLTAGMTIGGTAEPSRVPNETGKPDKSDGVEPERTDKPKSEDRSDASDAVKEVEEVTSSFAVQSFSDVPTSFWGYEQIERAAKLGVIVGIGDGSFHPNENVTRAQFVLMLWRLAGKPQATSAAPFADVTGLSEEFRAAIGWAAENGVVNGVSKTEFLPDADISRQQAMTILFRYSGGVSGLESMLTAVYDEQFIDSGAITPMMKPGMYWAFYNGIINGVSANMLAPQETATRAQSAAILIRYADLAL